MQERGALAPLRPSGDARAARRRRLLFTGFVAALVIGLDQVTKSLAVARLSAGPVHVIGPVSFALAYNSGIAFSLFTGLTLPIILIVVTLIGLLSYLARGASSAKVAVALGMILGGALSNLSDRLFRGHGGAVVDFVHTSFWPTFNVADASIVLGCVLLAAVVLFDHHEPKPATRAGRDDDRRGAR